MLVFLDQGDTSSLLVIKLIYCSLLEFELAMHARSRFSRKESMAEDAPPSPEFHNDKNSSIV